MRVTKKLNDTPRKNTQDSTNANLNNCFSQEAELKESNFLDILLIPK